MKKTLAIALVLVMVVSCLSILLVSADEVESLTVNFMQLESTSVTDSSVVLFPAGDSDLDLASETANLRWATGIATDAEGTIVRVTRNLLSVEQDKNNEFDNHSILVPAGGYAIVFHCGDGESTSGSDDALKLRDYVNELLTAAGVGAVENTVADVSSLGWQIADLTTDGGDYDFGHVTLYKGPAPGGDEPNDETTDDENNETTTPDEPKEPEIVEVEEVIEIDGDLTDTGWVKADWTEIDTENGKVQNDSDMTGVAFKYAVRADENFVYIALSVNRPAKDVDTSLATFDDIRVTGTGLRFYLEVDETTGKFDRLLDILVEDGEAVAYLAKEATDAYTVKMISDEENTTFELALSIEALGIGETFKMAACYSDASFGEEGTAYNVLNDHLYEDNATAPWAIDDNYTTYTVADLLLGTYEIEVEPSDPTVPDEPEVPDTYEEDIAALVGEDVEDPDFNIDLAYAIEEDGDKTIVVITLTVKDIKEGVLPQSLDANLIYDIDRLTLLNEYVKDEKDGTEALGCVTTLPGASWENMTKTEVDEEGNPTGKIEISFVGINPDHVLTEETPIELTFRFELKADFDKAGVYVPTESVGSVYAEAGGSSVVEYVGNGAYVIAKVEPKVDDTTTDDTTTDDVTTDDTTTESEPTPTESESTPGTTTPGDNGILLFAVLGILAVAGAATVIKVRS